MRFAPTEDQLALAEGVNELLAAECTPAVVRLAAEQVDGSASGSVLGSGPGRLPSLWSQLHEMGVLALEIPESAGGLGFGPMEMGLVMEAAGRVALPEPLLSTAAVAAPVLAGSSSEVAKEWTQRIAEGATVAVGLAAQPVVHAASADAFLLQLGDELHVVRPDDVELVPTMSVDRSRPLAFVNVGSTAGTIGAGTIGGGTAVGGAGEVAQALDRAALACSAQLLGLSESMIAMSVAYAAERKQFGVPIGSFQAVKHHLANAELAVSFARPVVRRAAYSMAVGDSDVSLHVSMAKAAASDAAHRVGQLTLQCHGAIAYTVEYDHQLFLKRAWALGSRYGDAAFHRERVAAAILDS